MEIIIEGKESIAEIKAQFEKAFPLLKIEFFKHSHQAGEGSPWGDRIDDDIMLGSLGVGAGVKKLTVNREMKIAYVEKEFRDKYGLNVQVFRKSGNIWLEIITTDQRTLAEESEWAMEMSRPVE